MIKDTLAKSIRDKFDNMEEKAFFQGVEFVPIVTDRDDALDSLKALLISERANIQNSFAIPEIKLDERPPMTGIEASMLYGHKVVMPDLRGIVTASMIGIDWAKPDVQIKYQKRKCEKRGCKHMAPRHFNMCSVHSPIRKLNAKQVL